MMEPTYVYGLADRSIAKVNPSIGGMMSLYLLLVPVVIIGGLVNFAIMWLGTTGAEKARARIMGREPR